MTAWNQPPPFTYFLRVRYGECDAQKVVFNARYGDYVDVAVNEFVRAIGFGDSMIGGDLDFQLVRQTIEWKASARFDQVLGLSVTAQRLGRTSFTLQTEFRCAGDERVIATAETVYVLVTAVTFEKIVLPEALRTALLEGARGRITDHAGLGDRLRPLAPHDVHTEPR
jgi:acyl-CoA thioester hydrolase